jgi:hypothetical protein
VHRVEDVLVRRVGGQLDLDRLDADLAAVAVLARDVRPRAGVGADQDRPQARPVAELCEERDAGRELVLHLAGDGCAVQHRC